MSGSRVFEHGGDIHAARRQSAEKVKWLDFSANINPMGIPASIRKAITHSLEDIIHYPDPHACELREGIAGAYHVPVEQIIPGNGAVELIYVLCHMRRPRRVLVTAPTFSEYERAARASGAVVDYVYLSPDSGFTVSIQHVIENLSGADMLFVCNPNNPTGALLQNGDLEKIIAAAARQQVFVVVDESFLDFLPDDSLYTCRLLLSRYPNLLIIHSLTKFYAIPGLRLGFALAGKETADMLNSGKDQWNVNHLAQAAGVAALADVKYREDSRQYLLQVKESLYSDLCLLSGCKVYPSPVNFILMDISGTGMEAGQLRQYMLEQNIMIRDCGNYRGLSPFYVRVAVKREEENIVLIQVLRTILCS